jgi:predicted nucleotidyltransferase
MRDRRSGAGKARKRLKARRYIMVLPRRYYMALLHAARRRGSPAAQESTPVALLLHENPAEAPPQEIELALTAEELQELRELGWHVV